MKFDKQLSSLMSAALLCGTFTTPAISQQAAGSGPVAPASTAIVTPAPKVVSEEALLKSTPPLTEEALQTRFVGKLVFLRGSYLGDDLQFDVSGKVIGSPAVGSFTLSAFEIRKVKLSKHKLDLEADRYGLHFFGALPYEDDTKSFDKVKISKKPVHIAIDRELIVVPKVKKEKNKKDAPAPAPVLAAQTPKAPNAPTVTPAPPPATAIAAADLPGAVSPAHSAMLMNKALDNIFASDIDQAMMSHLPDFWQEYFTSKSQHRQYMPADGNVKIISEGMTPPKVMNSIDPSSNEYAQKYGIAGMELLRTVVDANGVPRQMAIARPIGFGLDEKAVDAIKNSRFRPATLNGQPVPVVVDLVVTFRIYSNRTKPGSVTKDSKETVLAASVADTDSSKSSASDASLKR
jgi:TonB family protein